MTLPPMAKHTPNPLQRLRDVDGVRVRDRGAVGLPRTHRIAKCAVEYASDMEPTATREFNVPKASRVERCGADGVAAAAGPLGAVSAALRAAPGVA